NEQLSEAEREAFEQHYLGCQSCFEELQFRHAAAIELKRPPPVPPRLALVLWSSRWTWGLAAAAVLLLTFVSVTTFYRHQHPQMIQKSPTQSEIDQQIIASLAVVDAAPPYVPVTIRGGKTGAATERFREGMQRYIQHDYAGAIGLLQEAIRLDANLQPALFYLGISHLMLDHPDEAGAQLSRLSHPARNPYTEGSHSSLANASL